jgi:ADP-ribose pyrophosphatase YjhB (NUDIX family)
MAACDHPPMADQVRALRFLVPDAAGSHLLLADDGSLPSRTVTLADDETTVQGAIRTMRGEFGLHVPLLEVHFDYAFAHDDRGESAVPALVVAEPPGDDWSPPDGMDWSLLATADPAVESGLTGRLGELLAEHRGDLPIASLRPRWARTGWHARATGWMFATLDELGRPPTGPIEQIRHWGISALMRAPTDQGTVWFKAVLPLFAVEPAISAFLAEAAPEAVAPVLAHDDAQGWLLMEDVGSTMVVDHAEADALTIEALVALQRRFVGDLDALAATGAPRRPFADVPDALERALRDAETAGWVHLEPARIDRLVDATREAVATIDALGFPETIVHGDFHPSNVALRDGRPVIFDWSDGAIAHPIVDAMTWVSWLHDDDPDRAERAWLAFLEAWSDVCPPETADLARPALRVAAAAYHAVSYHAIVMHMEPHRRPETADGLEQYVGHLDDAVPR